jgi:hypothetical protein
MMTEVICKIIPLYKFEIIYEEEKIGDRYTWAIVSDTINGIIKGIVDREVNFGENLKDMRKYLDIRDFLFMPYPDIKRGYCLFDVLDHDCVADIIGATNICDAWYDCRFGGDEPTPVDVIEYDRLVGESFPVEKGEEIFTCHSKSYAMADAVYDMSLNSLIRLRENEKKRDLNDDDMECAYHVLRNIR